MKANVGLPGFPRKSLKNLPEGHQEPRCARSPVGTDCVQPACLREQFSCEVLLEDVFYLPLGQALISWAEARLEVGRQAFVWLVSFLGQEEAAALDL